MNKNELQELLSALSTEMSPEDLLFAHYASDIAVAITAKRTSLGLSQSDFAHQLGKSQAMISKWENADCNFTLKTLIEIAQQLGFTLKISLEPKSDGDTTSEITQSNIIQFPGGYVGMSSPNPMWGQASSSNDELKEM